MLSDIFSIQTLLIAIVLVVAISIHEYAHAWCANKLGDPTPRLQWRLTPNPLVHIDPFGFILIFIIHFGWWRPVYTNPSYFRNPVRDDFLVAMAGPMSNFILAILGFIILCILWLWFGYNQIEIANIIDFWIMSRPNILLIFRAMFAMYNIALAIFNLLPLFPLDGYRIIKIISPKAGYFLERNGQVAMIITIIIIFSGARFIIPQVTYAVSQMMFKLISQPFF